MNRVACFWGQMLIPTTQREPREDGLERKYIFSRGCHYNGHVRLKFYLW